MPLGVSALLAIDSAIERIFTSRQEVALFDLTGGFSNSSPYLRIQEGSIDRWVWFLQSTYQTKMPSGLVTVRLASILIRLGQRRMAVSHYWLQVAPVDGWIC